MLLIPSNSVTVGTRGKSRRHGLSRIYRIRDYREPLVHYNDDVEVTNKRLQAANKRKSYSITGKEGAIITSRCHVLCELIIATETWIKNIKEVINSWIGR
jgi:hypothetical protein